MPCGARTALPLPLSIIRLGGRDLRLVTRTRAKALRNGRECRSVITEALRIRYDTL